MSNGTLQVRSTSARLSAGLPGVQVTLQSEDNRYPGRYTLVTGEDGNASVTGLPAPDKSLSLVPDSAERPYSVWTLQAEMEGYVPLTLTGVQVFDGQTTLARLAMTPLDTVRPASAQPVTVEIPPHPLYAGSGGSGPAPVELSPFVLDQVVIPKTITVHLGTPASSARNVTVSFQEYIANVASSEVYPTWADVPCPTVRDTGAASVHIGTQWGAGGHGYGPPDARGIVCEESFWRLSVYPARFRVEFLCRARLEPVLCLR